MAIAHFGSNHVIISRLDSLQCPIKILSSYLREAQIELASGMYIFRPISFLAHLTSILHVALEKKIIKISANQRLLWSLAAMLDNRS
jgi:hypothetical protein